MNPCALINQPVLMGEFMGFYEAALCSHENFIRNWRLNASSRKFMRLLGSRPFRFVMWVNLLLRLMLIYFIHFSLEHCLEFLSKFKPAN